MPNLTASFENKIQNFINVFLKGFLRSLPNFTNEKIDIEGCKSDLNI